MPPISRRHMLGTAAALLAGGLAACGGSGDDATPPRTTLLVYLLGSNLESMGNAGTTNLLEMLAAQGSAYTRVIITTGGADKRDPDGLVPSWKTVKRFELANGALKELADLGARDMDSSDTLQDFLIWGVRTYPAERTMLALWDHGSGYYGYGGDENYPGEGKMMSLPAMSAALQGFKAATGITLDYIGFDACLMATLEVAKAVQPYARYLGASQELEPGTGWDWKSVIETAARQPAPSLPEFGQIVATAFHDKQLRERPEGSPIPPLSDYVTFSIIDLARLPPLLERLEQWASAVHAHYDSGAKRANANGGVFWPPTFAAALPRTKAMPGTLLAEGDAAIERWKQVAMARVRTTTFGYEPDAKDALDLVDLRQFAALLSTDGIASGPQAALNQALQDAIVFNITGPQARNASGLSIYFPLRTRSARQRNVYQALAMPSGYMGLLERHTRQAEQAPSAIYIAPLQVRGDTIFGDITSLYGVQLADLLQVQPAGAGVVKITGSTPIAAAEIVEGYGQVLYDTQQWLQLGGQPLLLYTLSIQISEGGSLNAALYGAPVRLKSARTAETRIVLLLLNYKWDPATMRMTGEIIGARDIDFSDPSDPTDRVDRDIYAGDTVEPLHILYDVAKQAPVAGPGGGIAFEFGSPVTVALDSALRPAPLAAGSHTLMLSVTDLAGAEALSQPLAFTKR